MTVATRLLTAGPSWIAALAAVGALIVSIHSAQKIVSVEVKIEEVRHATNSMKDELVAVTAKASKAEGVKEEKERQK